LLTHANSNTDADENDIENEATSVTTSFNYKASGEHLTIATKLANFFFGKRSITRAWTKIP
jgi:hypothetical protein